MHATVKPLAIALLVAAVASGTFAFCRAGERRVVADGVANGSFELSQNKPGVPDDWQTAGNASIRQSLGLDVGRDGKRCAKLQCTVFGGNAPDSHAMICQVGKVGAKQGHWYRLAFWARSDKLAAGSIDVGLKNTRPWGSAGLDQGFAPSANWRFYELRFKATADLPTATSRLQFSFKSTGTLWLDDVTFEESAGGPQWCPQIPTDGVKNFVPNSSFECGGANWGSITFGLEGWAGNLYRLESDVDASLWSHGQHSMQIVLDPKTAPVFCMDYYTPLRQPVRRLLVANQGWFKVNPGEKLTLSADLCADADGTPAQLAVNDCANQVVHKPVTVGRRWQRQEFTFAPTQPFVFVAVGLDLEGSTRGAATLWVDSVQLERGDHATAYEPREPVESFLESGVPGNLFTDVAKGGSLTVRAFNDSGADATVRGELALTDFFDRPAFTTTPSFQVAAHASASTTIGEVCKGRRGFYRASWASAGTTRTLRCALLDPADRGALDSPFGVNHAYPWDFLVQLARQAGVAWWRDWSATWQTVEPQKGRFDFTAADGQVQRELDLDGHVEVLLPFPSSQWSTTANPKDVDRIAGNDQELRARLPFAYPPKDLADFGRYAAAVASHYAKTRPRSVTHFQVLNEPIYTTFALPQQLGLTVRDYVKFLESASSAIKAADPQASVVGGISADVDTTFTRDFVEQGGLKSIDVLDLHMYDAPRAAETYDEPFRALQESMQAHGGPRPIWIGEWGLYADDDPPTFPLTVGDAAMNRCIWPSERAAAEHLVKFTAVAFAHGVRKIFLHAGRCGTVNGPDAAGVLFEYGGAPRKTYASLAVLTRLFGVPDDFVQSVHADGSHAYVFHARGRAVAIAWCESDRARALKLEDGVTMLDVMGNELAAGDAALTSSPVYLVATDAGAIVRSLAR